MTECILLIIFFIPVYFVMNILTICWFFDFKSEKVRNIIKQAINEVYIEHTRGR